MALWRFLICFLSLLCGLVGGQTTKYGLLGQTAIFNTGIKTQPDDILWKHNGNKAVEFNGQEQQSFGSFEGRVSLNWHSADLTINNLRYEDSGDYELETFTNNKMDRTFYKLEVIDKVFTPAISCKINNAKTADQSGDKATLTCSSPSRDPQSLLTFQWSSDANIHPGAELNISLRGEDDDQIYRCAVSNRLSQESATFSAKDCYSDKKSQAGLIAGVVVAVLVLLLLIALVGFCIVKRNNPKKTDVENHLPHDENEVLLEGEPAFFNNQAPGQLDPVKSSDNEKRKALLHRDSTMPSKQTLSHLRQSGDEPYPNHEEKSKNEHSEISFSSPVPEKPPRTFSERHAKENGKSSEGEPKDAVEDEPSGSDWREENAESSVGHDDKKQEPAENLNNKEDDPADSEETNETSTNSPDEYSPEKPINRFQRAPSGPPVAPKPKIQPKLPTEQKLGDENMPANVNKEQSLENDPPDSGIETEESAAASDNQNDKKQEPAENLNNKEDDPADSEETNETSTNSPDEHSPEKPINRFQRAPSGPRVAPKPKILPKLPTEQKLGDENMLANVNKEQSLENDPPGSGIETEESAAASDNQNDKKEEPAENLNNKEDDPADSEETNETSPNEPNEHSLESSTNKGNDPPDTEIAPEESAAATSDNQNDKKQESAENLNNKEDDPADSEETNETSPNEPNEHSLESSSNEGNDPPDSEMTPEESAAATSDNQDSQNKKVENESAKATSDDDVQPPPAANSPLSQKSP
ncbi:sporozoite surface protein 2 isoform X3 [Fundulus heteroclitus]|uniref:sporozoite surface protein 2 isoform X3 n=1 Tax=Fundulus heteroclitus TaxID=8078 RepID=UPI00165CB07C|nr:sporozoite surface protein 2 isoform X3 [Fundulus heteroclitus]